MAHHQNKRPRVKVKPSKEELERLYLLEKKSSIAIGEIYGVHSKTIRSWMERCGIKRLGSTHLRKGVSATWNKGRKCTTEQKARMSAAQRASKVGKSPWNFGNGRIRFNCEHCGVEVFALPYRRRRVCSKKCRDALNRTLRGERHWNYVGEETVTKARERGWADYHEWRKEVLRRCKRTCVACGMKVRRHGKITAHHLYGFKDHPELRFDPNNGVALCWPCHVQFHRETSWRHATPDMFYEWLTKKPR